MVAPIVSIVVPVYNARRTLEATVESVRSQTREDWELLLVDDASRDGSADLVRSLAERDPRIRPLFLETNGGAAEARNAGVRATRGRFVAFLDSDDLWLPTKLEKQVALHESTQAGMTFTDYEWIDADDNFLKVVVRGPDRPTWESLTWGNDIGLSTAMIDRDRIGPPLMPNIRLNHDYAMWLDFLRRGCKAVRLPEVLVRYRMLPDSLSQNKFESALWNWKILHRMQNLSIFQTLPRLALWSLRTAGRRLVPWIPGR